MAVTSINDVITALVPIARSVVLTDNWHPFVRDLNNSPASLSQGDNPQVFFHPAKNAAKRLTFNSYAGSQSHRTQRDFTVLVYFIDSINLVPVWQSRPRVTQWCNDFVQAIDGQDDLGLDDLYAEASADVRDGLMFNQVPFRGGIITLTGYYFY